MKWIVFIILTIGLSTIAGNMTGTGSKRLPTQQDLDKELRIKDSLHSEVKLRIDLLKYRYNHLKK